MAYNLRPNSACSLSWSKNLHFRPLAPGLYRSQVLCITISIVWQIGVKVTIKKEKTFKPGFSIIRSKFSNLIAYHILGIGQHRPCFVADFVSFIIDVLESPWRL